MRRLDARLLDPFDYLKNWDSPNCDHEFQKCMRVSGIFEFYAYGVEIKLEVSLVAKSFIDS